MKAKVGIWMPLYIGDYLSDTMHLTTEQHGAYLLIIMAYWKNGGELPGAAIQAITRLQGDAWSNAQAVLSMMFSIEENGNWRHERIERELVDAGKKKDGATAKAKAGAAARWAKAKQPANNDAPGNPSSNAPSITQALPEQCPSPSPSNNKIKSSCNQAAPDNAKAPAVPFQKIMDAYCQALPNLPQPQAMTEKRKTALRGIWREFEKCRADDFWQRYFAYVGKSDFLVGMRGIGIDWLINKANFYKVIEGNYHHA